MKLFDGKKAAQKILAETKKEIVRSGKKPRLAIILVGEDEASKLYVKLKKSAAKKIGIEVEEFDFLAVSPEKEILSKISELNEDAAVSGIIVQLPLPAALDKNKIIGAIDAKKDVDGFHAENQKMLKSGKFNFFPVLPLAILTAIKDALGDNFEKKKALALVNSETFGSVLKAVLEKEKIKMEFLVRNACLVSGAEKEMREADILISVCGCPKMIKVDMIKEGAALIDAGITRYHDGKVAGDVDQESVFSKASFLTPMPGGVGPLTVALLLRNVFLASR